MFTTFDESIQLSRFTLTIKVTNVMYTRAELYRNLQNYMQRERKGVVLSAASRPFVIGRGGVRRNVSAGHSSGLNLVRTSYGEARSV